MDPLLQAYSAKRKRGRRVRRWVVWSALALLILLIGVWTWLWVIPPRVTMRQSSWGGGCKNFKYVCIGATVTNRSLRHAYIGCTATVVDGDGRVIAHDAAVSWEQTPIGWEVRPLHTDHGFNGVLEVTPPPGAFSIVPHCHAIYPNGPAPV